MKKLFLMCALCMIAAAQTFAQTYGFLTIQKNDGTQQSFATSGLKLTFSNGNLIATQGGNETTLALTDLNKMFFSETATGVKLDKVTEKNSPIVVFTVAGAKIGEVKNILDVQNMAPGVYIIKQGNNTSKILVK